MIQGHNACDQITSERRSNIPVFSLMFNRELDSCLDPNRPAVLRDSIELELSIKLMVSGVGFFGFLGNVKDERLRSTPDLLNLAPRCFCFSVAVKIKYNMRVFMTSESDVLIINYNQSQIKILYYYTLELQTMNNVQLIMMQQIVLFANTHIKNLWVERESHHLN